MRGDPVLVHEGRVAIQKVKRHVVAQGVEVGLRIQRCSGGNRRIGANHDLLCVTHAEFVHEGLPGKPASIGLEVADWHQVIVAHAISALARRPVPLRQLRLKRQHRFGPCTGGRQTRPSERFGDVVEVSRAMPGEGRIVT